MTPQEEARFERKAEKMLAGHRMFPNGRDFRCFSERNRSDVNNSEFDRRFDDTFPDAPGTNRLDREFCPHCDRRLSICKDDPCNCDTGKRPRPVIALNHGRFR